MQTPVAVVVGGLYWIGWISGNTDGSIRFEFPY